MRATPTTCCCAARFSDDDDDGMAPLRGLLAAATSLGCAAAVRLLAQLDPSAASVEWPTEGEGSAAHRAAKLGHSEALRALLTAVPGAAIATSSGYHDRRGWEHDEWSVIHSAAEGGSLEAVQVLLEVAAHTAAAVTTRGLTPLHVAAEAGHAPVVQALLQAAPEAALVEDEDGELPLHWGACHVEVVRLLLAAAADTALDRTADGSTALHLAASAGAPASVQALLRAAPEAVDISNAEGHTPLRCGLEHLADWYGAQEDPQALRILVAAVPSPATLATIADFAAIDWYSGPVAPLFADFVAAAPPLTDEQWARVPTPCPHLGRALPAALACSHEQACQLVHRLPPADDTRLRTFALALARLQRRLRVALPSEVAGKLLSLCLAD